MACNNPKFKLYTGLVEQFEYCESCGEKKIGHSNIAPTADTAWTREWGASVPVLPQGNAYPIPNPNNSGISPQTQSSTPSNRVRKNLTYFPNMATSIRLIPGILNAYLNSSDYKMLASEQRAIFPQKGIYLVNTDRLSVTKVSEDDAVPIGFFEYD